MSISNGYCTLSEVTATLKRTLTSDQQDFISRCIERASRKIDQYTARKYYKTTISGETLDCVCPSLNGLYITDSLTRIYLPGPLIIGDDDQLTIIEDGVTLVRNTDYIVRQISSNESCIDRIGGLWSTNDNALSITASFGYETVPDYVNQWCITIAAVLSGLSVTTVKDPITQTTHEIVDKNIPKWVFDEMKSNRRTIV